METSPAAQRLTSRFVAGLQLENALRVAAELQNSGMLTSLDHLGENVTSLNDAREARDAYLEALESVHAEALPSTVSMKVTALGLDLSDEACFEHTAALAETARRLGTRVEMDMESSEYTDRNLRLVFAMHERFASVRAVIQAYLYRSEGDIEALCSKGIPVRLCKGAYREPPTVAYQRKSEVDAQYLKLMRVLLERGQYPALATHDDRIIEQAAAMVRSGKYAAEKFEFQMLYGVRRTLQRCIVDEGFRLRVYVPYGAAWYPYFMRRMAERPANAVFVLRSLLGG